MSAGDRLTEVLKVRLSASEKVDLELYAGLEDRSASSLARRAIRNELERLAKTKAPRPAGDAA